MRQADHLRQIGQRALAAVVLPIGVGEERDRRVEGQIRGDGGLIRRIERQQRLQPHQPIDDEEAADMEQQHGDRISQPMLLAFFVDAADPVKPAFDRTQHRGQKGGLAVEDAGHVPAERLYERDHDGAIQKNLNPADDGHCRESFRISVQAAAGE